LQRVRSLGVAPILVARKVMEETDHVMLAGEGAQRFARVMGFGDHDPVTPERRADWNRSARRWTPVLGKHGLKMRRFLKDHPEYAGGTVGAAAVDVNGVLAAATSTGGVTMKLVGRVGDSPLAGAGNYASRHVAASATGTGEFVIRSLAARSISEAMERGATPAKRARRRAWAASGATSTPTSASSPWTAPGRRSRCIARATCRTPFSRRGRSRRAHARVSAAPTRSPSRRSSSSTRRI
jgi:beta-aspartyl-peptidase (threonine type)